MSVFFLRNLEEHAHGLLSMVVVNLQHNITQAKLKKMTSVYRTQALQEAGERKRRLTFSATHPNRAKKMVQC